MKGLVILGQYGEIEVEVENIYDPTNHKLFLIGTKEIIAKLQNKNTVHFFDEVIELEQGAFDVPTLENKTALLVKNHVIDDVKILSYADRTMRVCGELKVKFEGGLNLDRFIDKTVNKSLLLNTDISTPKYEIFNRVRFIEDSLSYINEISERLSYPMFIKPIDQVSCRGAAKINNQSELNAWCESNKEYNGFEFEIDEFIHGSLYHCDSLIKNNEVIYTQVGKYCNTCFDFVCGLPLGSIVLPEQDQEAKEMQEFTKNVLSHLTPPKNGVTHLELFKRSNGELVFLEVAARPAGLQTASMYKKYLNVDLNEAHALLHIDEKYMPHVNLGTYSAYISYPCKDGYIKELKIPELKSSHEIIWFVKEGDTTKAVENLADRACEIILWNNNYEYLQEDFLFLKEFVPFYM